MPQRDVVHVDADMRLTGSISNLELARTVIERWPSTHMLLGSGAAALPPEARAPIAIRSKAQRGADLIEEGDVAMSG